MTTQPLPAAVPLVSEVTEELPASPSSPYSNNISDFSQPELHTLGPASIGSPVSIPAPTSDSAIVSAVSPSQVLDAASASASTLLLATSTCVSSAATPIYVPDSTSDCAKASALAPLQALDAASPSAPPLTDNAAMPTRIAEHLLHKNRLQEYTQRSLLDLPVYQTVNEGYAHAPKFRSTVFVDGRRYTSSNTFLHRKAAEQDVAKLALDCISKQIKDDECPLVREDPVFCKSILNEFAVKTNVDKPTYTTVLSQGLVPVFTSSLVFNGASYTGEPARTKKEAEQLAARAAILSILGNSGSGTTLTEIIKSKAKLYSALHKCKDLGYAQCNMASVAVNPGHSSENLISQEKKVEAADVSDNRPAGVILQLASGLHPPCHEFNKLNPTPLPVAITLPIAFVHPVMEEPLGKKRRKKKKKKKAKKKLRADV